MAQRLPSFGRAVAQARPQMALGIISKVSFPGVALNIDRLDSAVASRSGGLSALAFQRQNYERDSAYGHLVLAKLFSDAQHPATAVSAVKALAGAVAQGQTVVALTQANLGAQLPTLALGANAATRVQAAVAAGQRVLVARGLVSIGAWSGYALQIEDPATGAAAFELFDELGSGNAVLYPVPGMPWLALAQPFQNAAAISPALAAGINTDAVLAAALDANGTRWRFFAGQADVGNGLFLARIAAAQGAQACDAVSGVLAANLGTATGLDPAGGASAVFAPAITSVPVSAGKAGQAYHMMHLVK